MPRLPSRRAFLRTTMAVGAVGVAGGAGYYLTQDRIRLGLIGCGGRGTELAKITSTTAWVYHRVGDIQVVCDVDRNQADALKQKYCKGATWYEDYRKVLDRPDLDAVYISTCDHWHAPIAIAALKAGKAVYCEKPMTHVLAEGPRMIQAVKDSGKPFLMGTQQRSDGHFRTAADLVRAGRLGKISEINIILAGKGLKGGPFPPGKCPDGLNWDFWLGPAPLADYCEERNRKWQNWWEYSGGQMTAWGTHHIDSAMWAIGEPWNGPITISAESDLPHIANGYSTPVDFTVKYKLPNGVVMTVRAAPPEGSPESQSGMEIVGDKSKLWASRTDLRGPAVDELKTNPLHEPPLHPSPAPMQLTTVQHLRHFFDCVRGESTPVADVSAGHRTAALCHIGNIAVRLNRPLTWDPGTEHFVNDSEADALLDYEARAKYM
jgi:myo-inositol 2-dehydrogenase / D-chiro-inositol 1-dehydrogenase